MDEKINNVRYHIAEVQLQHFGNILSDAAAEKILKELIPDSWINPSLECAEIFLDWLSSLNYFEMCYNDNDFAIEAVDQLFANNQPSH